MEKLKAEGVSGREIINKLIEGSDTFNKRTKFSQEKYLRKKNQKYNIMFEARKPTAADICDVYSSIGPDKICGLRADSLALILNMANINCNSRVLLVENTRGFLTGALVEKRVASILKVEFGAEPLKMRMDILLEYGFNNIEHMRI